MSASEAVVKRRIREYLKTLGGEGHFWASPPSRYGDSGLPDRMGVYRGWPIAIEIKAEDGSHPVTDNQIDFLKRFQGAGGISIIARSVEDIQKRISGLTWRITDPPDV